MTLHAPLFDGPIDIIGDVHGEITAMRHLLYKLGYDESGRHRKGRRLVFLGDLVDRGPDSPGVVDAVMALVKSGRAQCILGNHELNILLNRPMHGNGWFIQPNSKEKSGSLKSQVASPLQREKYFAFFSTLPLALENDTLRVVHACWNVQAIEAIKSAREQSVQVLYQQYQQRYLKAISEPEFVHKLDAEQLCYAGQLSDSKYLPPFLPTLAKKECLEQMSNPVRILTTSSMIGSETPFFGGGKWRMAERDAWWDTYEDDKPVIIGHFWRQFSQLNEQISGVFGKDLFSEIEPHAWMGAQRNVYCVDYSVGQRHLERQIPTEGFYGKLAALRMPECQVMHDDGIQLETY